MVNLFVLIIAFIVAGVAAYFSVIGIGLIFSGSFWAAVVMGSSLEAAKIVAVSWLYRYWNIAHFFLKSYLIIAIVILSLITSLGIFGFLSKAHIEQQSNLETGASSQVVVIDEQITQKQNSIAEINKQIALIDDAIRKMIDTNRAQASLKSAEQQRKIRNTLNLEKAAETKILNELTLQKTILSNEVKKAQVEVGPLRYISEFFFENSDQGTLERAVRWMIIIIIFVFDPLSIALFIAYNTMASHKEFLTNKQNSDIFQIHKNDIKEI